MALTAKKVYAILKRQISNMEAKLNSPVRYRGTVAIADLLPLNPDIGDMYNIESKSVYGEAGMNVAWNGVVWDTMGAPIDMSLYLTKEEAETVIQRLVTEYFEKNPVKPGATTEQAQQIEQNKTVIASLKEDIGDLFSSKISKFYASSQGETHLADSDNGKIMDMMVYGKSEQKKYQGYQLLEHNTSEYNFTATTSYHGLVNNASENIKSGAYYLRKLGNTPTVLITFLDASKKMVKQEYLTDGSEKRIVFETDVAYVKYIIQNLTAGTDYKGTVKLILASTSGADYEPYVGGQPSPSPDYPQEIKSVVNPTIKVRGKNLFDQAKVFKNIDINVRDIIGLDCRNIVGIKSQRRYYLIECKPNTKYYITFVNPTNNIYIGIADKNYIGIKNIAVFENFTSRIFTTSNDANFIVLNADATSDICLSTDDVNYEPYTEQTIQLPYTLNAIPVESGGNVTINGQKYIADYVDVERGKIVRNVENITFNGAENENWELWNADKEKMWSFMFVNSLKTFTNGSVSKCNRFEFNANESIDRTFWLCNPSGMPSLQIKNRIIGKDITAFKSWLSNNPINVIYPLRIPIEEELTAEHAQALKELATYYPVTNISIGSEQLDGYTVFNYPISIANGWNYVKKQLNDNRDYIYDMDIQSAEAYVNSEYAVVLTELEV